MTGPFTAGVIVLLALGLRNESRALYDQLRKEASLGAGAVLPAEVASWPVHGAGLASGCARSTRADSALTCDSRDCKRRSSTSRWSAGIASGRRSTRRSSRAGAAERDPYLAPDGRILIRSTASVMSAAAVPHVIAETTGSLEVGGRQQRVHDTPAAKATYARRWSHCHVGCFMRRFIQAVTVTRIRMSSDSVPRPMASVP